jgi:hypothetical protein
VGTGKAEMRAIAGLMLTGRICIFMHLGEIKEERDINTLKLLLV